MGGVGAVSRPPKSPLSRHSPDLVHNRSVPPSTWPRPMSVAWTPWNVWNSSVAAASTAGDHHAPISGFTPSPLTALIAMLFDRGRCPCLAAPVARHHGITGASL